MKRCAYILASGVSAWGTDITAIADGNHARLLGTLLSSPCCCNHGKIRSYPGHRGSSSLQIAMQR
jgi:hypothetical protein